MTVKLFKYKIIFIKLTYFFLILKEYSRDVCEMMDLLNMNARNLWLLMKSQETCM